MNHLRLNDTAETVIDLDAYAVFQKAGLDDGEMLRIDAITCTGNSVSMHYETTAKLDEDYDHIAYMKGAR